MSANSREFSDISTNHRTFEATWQKWGSKLGFSQSTFEEIWADSEKTYVKGAPFHDFEHHAVDVLWSVMDMADTCEANDHLVSRRALVPASLQHDSGYYLDHSALNFDSKEALSKDIFLQNSPKYGLSKKETAIGAQAIMSTKVGIRPISLEDKILRRADLENVAGEYRIFRYRTRLLGKEALVLFGRQKSDSVSIAESSLAILSEYFSDSLALGDFDVVKGGRSQFELRAIANLKHLAKDIAARKHESYKDVARRLGDSVLKLLAS